MKTIPWEGLLYRRRIVCSSASEPFEEPLDGAEVDLFHEVLNAQAKNKQRKLYTVVALPQTAAGSTLLQADYTTGFAPAAYTPPDVPALFPQR